MTIAEELRPRDWAVLRALDGLPSGLMYGPGEICTKVKSPRLLSGAGAAATLDRLARMGLVRRQRRFVFPNDQSKWTYGISSLGRVQLGGNPG